MEQDIFERILASTLDRRQALKTAAGAAVGLALAACGPSQASGKTKSIKLLASDLPPFLQANKYWATQAKSKLGIDIAIEPQPYGNLFAKATAAWIAGTADFDLIIVANQWTGEWAQAGLLENLDSYVQSDSGIKKDDFIQRSWESTGSWKGKDGKQHQFEIPFNSEGRIRFYRTDLFEKAKRSVPTSFPEYLDTLKFFNKNPDFPNVYGAVEMFGKEQGPAIVHELYQSMFPWDKVKTSNAWWDDNFQVIMDEGLVADAIRKINSILPYQPGGVQAYNLPEAINFFEAGIAAMTEVWPSVYGATLTSGTKLPGKVGASPVLSATVGGPSKPFLGGWGMAINAKSPADRKQAAWEFIKLSTSAEAERHDWESYARGPSRKSVYNDPDLQKKSFWLKAMGEAAANGVNAGRIKGMADFYGGDFWVTCNQGMVGSISPEKAASGMKKALVDLLTKNGYPQK
jgi:multiple sugar transport system substrate-binding protein